MKKINEMNKVELRKNLTWVKKQIIKFRKGEALAYEYENFTSLLSWKDLAYKYINELKERNLVQADKTNIDSFLNEYYKADKFLENKLNW